MTAPDSGFGVDAELNLDLTIGRMSQSVDRLAANLARRAAQPVYYRAADDVLIAGGVGIVELGGPTQGYLWHVRSLVAGGLTPDTAAAGVADVYVGAAQLQSLSLADWRDRAASLPLPAFYGVGELTLRHNEKLFVRFSGATNAQTYVAAMSAMVVQEAALAQTHDV